MGASWAVVIGPHSGLSAARAGSPGRGGCVVVLQRQLVWAPPREAPGPRACTCPRPARPRQALVGAGPQRRGRQPGAPEERRPAGRPGCPAARGRDRGRRRSCPSGAAAPPDATRPPASTTGKPSRGSEIDPVRPSSTCGPVPTRRSPASPAASTVSSLGSGSSAGGARRRECRARGRARPRPWRGRRRPAARRARSPAAPSAPAAAIQRGWRAMIRAAAPDTIAAAIEVPVRRTSPAAAIPGSARGGMRGDALPRRRDGHLGAALRERERPAARARGRPR